MNISTRVKYAIIIALSVLVWIATCLSVGEWSLKLLPILIVTNSLMAPIVGAAMKDDMAQFVEHK